MMDVNYDTRPAGIIEARLNLIYALIIANERPAVIAEEARVLIRRCEELSPLTPEEKISYDVRYNCWAAWVGFAKRSEHWLEAALIAEMGRYFFDEVEANVERVAQDGMREIAR